MVSDPINAVILSGYNDAVVEAYVENNQQSFHWIRTTLPHTVKWPLNAGAW